LNIDSSSWDKIISGFNGKKLSDRTKIYICGTLTRILRLAEQRGYNVEIPSMKNLGLPQSENRRLRVITRDEMNKILTELKILNLKAYNITLFSLQTGCRFGEAASLKWNDISDTHIIFRETKNKTLRRIPVSKPIYELLSKIIKNESEYVFTNNKGEKYRDPPCSFMAVVNKLGYNSGRSRYDKITFHSLRHTAATYMAKYLDLRSLMDIFGWKNVAMAARYMHGDESAKKQALDLLGSMGEETQSSRVLPFNRRSTG